MSFGAMLAGLGGAAVGSMLMKKPKPPAIPQPIPSPSTVDVGYASEEERRKRRHHKGYGSTILSGGELGTATTYRKEVFG